MFGANKPSEKELSDHFNLIKFNNGLAISHKTIKYIKDRTENSERWTYALKRTSIPIIFINGPAGTTYHQDFFLNDLFLKSLQIQ